MHLNYHRENEGILNHRGSLPKTGYSQLQSTSNRCISVNKHEIKPSFLNSSLANKTAVQPKQLSVDFALFSTISAKAITMTSSGESSVAGLPGTSLKTALRPSSTSNGSRIRKALSTRGSSTRDFADQSTTSSSFTKLFPIRKCCSGTSSTTVRYFPFSSEK